MQYCKTGKISLKSIFKKWRTSLTESLITHDCPVAQCTLALELNGEKGVYTSLNILSCLWDSIFFAWLVGLLLFGYLINAK